MRVPHTRFSKDLLVNRGERKPFIFRALLALKLGFYRVDYSSRAFYSEENQPISNMKEEMIFIPTEPSARGSCILSRNIPAIRLEGQTGQRFGKAKLGLIMHLPAGSRLELCGDGFNPRTVKVRHHDSYYFVFEEDLGR